MLCSATLISSKFTPFLRDNILKFTCLSLYGPLNTDRVVFPVFRLHLWCLLHPANYKQYGCREESSGGIVMRTYIICMLLNCLGCALDGPFPTAQYSGSLTPSVSSILVPFPICFIFDIDRPFHCSAPNGFRSALVLHDLQLFHWNHMVFRTDTSRLLFFPLKTCERFLGSNSDFFDKSFTMWDAGSRKYRFCGRCHVFNILIYSVRCRWCGQSGILICFASARVFSCRWRCGSIRGAPCCGWPEPRWLRRSVFLCFSCGGTVSVWH